MAKNETVWGVDVGNTSLKALRCRKGAEPGSLEILNFDYIEHSKILTQPGADADEIMAETLKLFLSRNNIKGEKIAISVSGQNALWRYQPLPPIDPKKVPELIKYEVKQWLPFDLQDVIWDYRQVGGTVEGGIALDLFIFMYAMKRETAKRTLERYAASNIDVDCIQGAQVALYNSFVHDLYDYDALLERDINELNDFDVILNVGTDATEIVVTNGVAVWLRNIPVGGNLFTKALTKSLKLTFSNAEHIKRNAGTAQDPKAVILAMKPVFNDMLTEIDRSIKYYCSLNKKAKIRRIYALGNAMKLPGLRQFLSKSLGLDVVVPNSFVKLRGEEALSNNLFKDNVSAFGVAYGLALQLLGEAPLNINLVPRDVVQQRLIEQKKPWALAAASLLGLGLTVQYLTTTSTYNVVQNPELDSAQKQAESVASKSKDLIAKATAAVTEFKKFDDIGSNLTSGVEGRLTWMELLKAINSVIPAEAPNKAILEDGVSPMKVREIKKQNRIYINNIEVQDVEELGDWFELVRRWYYIDDIEAQAFTTDAEGNPLEAPADAAAGKTADANAGSASTDASASASGSASSTAKKSSASGASSSGSSEYVPKYTLEQMFPFVPAAETKGASGSSKSGSKSSSSSSKSSSKSSSSKSSSSKSSSSKSSSSKSSSSKSSSSKSSSSSSSSSKAGSDLAAFDEFTEGDDKRLAEIPAPSGSGRIVQLTGYHYHNPDDVNDPSRGAEYIRRTILYNLKHGEIDLPISLERQRAGETGVDHLTLKEMGIYFPVMVDPKVIDERFRLLDPQAAAEARKELLKSMIKTQPGKAGSVNRQNGGMMGGGAGGMGGGMGGMSAGMGGGMSGGMSGGMGSGASRGGMGGGMSAMNNQIANQLSDDQVLNLARYDFTIQFVWMETPPSDRDARRKAAAEEAAKAAESAKGASGSGASDDASSTQDATDASTEDANNATATATTEDANNANAATEDANNATATAATEGANNANAATEDANNATATAATEGADNATTPATAEDANNATTPATAEDANNATTPAATESVDVANASAATEDSSNPPATPNDAAAPTAP